MTGILLHTCVLLAVFHSSLNQPTYSSCTNSEFLRCTSGYGKLIHNLYDIHRQPWTTIEPECRNFEDSISCLEAIKPDCDLFDQKIINGIIKSTKFLCMNRRAYIHYQSCILTAEVNSGIQLCLHSLQEWSGSSSNQFCGSKRDDVRCIHDEVQRGCNEEAGVLMSWIEYYKMHEMLLTHECAAPDIPDNVRLQFVDIWNMTTASTNPVSDMTAVPTIGINKVNNSCGSVVLSCSQANQIDLSLINPSVNPLTILSSDIVQYCNGLKAMRTCVLHHLTDYVQHDQCLADPAYSLKIKFDIIPQICKEDQISMYTKSHQCLLRIDLSSQSGYHADNNNRNQMCQAASELSTSSVAQYKVNCGSEAGRAAVEFIDGYKTWALASYGCPSQEPSVKEKELNLFKSDFVYILIAAVLVLLIIVGAMTCLQCRKLRNKKLQSDRIPRIRPTHPNNGAVSNPIYAVPCVLNNPPPKPLTNPTAAATTTADLKETSTNTSSPAYNNSSGLPSSKQIQLDDNGDVRFSNSSLEEDNCSLDFKSDEKPLSA